MGNGIGSLDLIPFLFSIISINLNYNLQFKMTRPSVKPLINSLVVGVIALLIMMAILLVQSCSKESSPPPNTAFLSITNTAPTLGTFNIYLNQNKANGSSAVNFGGTLPYFQIGAGEYTAKITTESSTESLLSKNITLEKDKVYSLFIINKPGQLDYLQVTDNIKNPVAEKAFIRFINLSPDAPALNLAFKDSTTLIQDKAYKAVSDFIEVNAKVYNFEIKDKATGLVKGDPLQSVDLKAGKTYTIISRGLLNPSDTERPFSGQVITNN